MSQKRYVLVPLHPTPEMVRAAEEAHMPFGDMDIALRMAILAAAPAQPAAQGEVRKARCISMRPGMGEVTLRMDNGRVPGFMDPGHEVFVLEAHPEPAAPAQPEVQRLREALEVRAEFEAWANGRCELHLVNSAGRYSSATTQFAWEAYQAGRAALGAQPAVNGYTCTVPDVTALVEALEEIERWVSRWCADDHPVATFARKALAAHRKQGGEE